MTLFSATAHTNIALIKYWGKSEQEANLPATGSLSLTLDKFFTSTSVEAIDRENDIFTLNGHMMEAKAEQRAKRHVDYFRTLSGLNTRFSIISHNYVPTSAGLASSASGFAALTVALAGAFGLNLSKRELSKIARRGSGSAARSLFKGFVLMHGGPTICDDEAYAEPIISEALLDARMLVVECARGEKSIGSREAMKLTAQTSVFYKAFLDNHPKLLNDSLTAIKSGDFERLGFCMEQSTLQMHATMLGCESPFWYFNETTVLALNEVKRLRQTGHSCFFTMDAGPHVKVLCRAQEADIIAASFAHIPGIENITLCGPGPGAQLNES